MPMLQFMDTVVAHSVQTAATYQQLIPQMFMGETIHPQPIPFFGNVQDPDVKYFTIGANPSAGEFFHRDWNGALTTAPLCARLLHYFDQGQNPHPWFATWNAALARLGIQFGQNLAHLDISYRATKSMGTFKGQQRALFDQMILDDSQFFLELLNRVLPRARGLLMAGTAGRHYINHLFNKIAAGNNLRLKLVRTLHPGPKARIDLLQLQGAGWPVPVFFCSSSPSDRWNPGLFVNHTHAVVPALQEHGF